jgi:hypothetical protein
MWIEALSIIGRRPFRITVCGENDKPETKRRRRSPVNEYATGRSFLLDTDYVQDCIHLKVSVDKDTREDSQNQIRNFVSLDVSIN